ncbi:MAG: hypothetical protein WAX66_00240 [Patescibacteria group bacterium]
MLKNDYFKAVLISLIFSFAVLVALPKIPVFVSNKLYKVDSHIGGYQIKLGKSFTLDLQGFKAGVDVLGGRKIILKVEAFDQRDKSEQMISIVEMVKRRLSLAGYSNWDVGVENVDEGEIYVLIPRYIDLSSVTNLVSGSGGIEIKRLANPSKWNIETASEIVMEPSEWVSTGITNEDISELRLIKDASGKDQIQITFNSKGKSKFKGFILNSLNKPFSINVNESQYPIAVPVVSQGLIDQPDLDPIITGGFQVDAIKHYLIQMYNPIPLKLSVLVDENTEAKLGNDFLNKYLLFMLIAFLVLFGFLVLKFKKYGLIGSASLILSLAVFCSSFKVFSLVVNIPSIVSFIFLSVILFDITSSILLKLSPKEISDKPVNLAIYQAFKVDTENVKLLLVVLLFSSLILLRFINTDIKSFILTLVLGSLIIGFHYFYSFKTFMELFGEKK